MVHGDNLKNITNPFVVDETGEIFNNFKPVEGMLGYFEFEVQVVDTRELFLCIFMKFLLWIKIYFSPARA